jgi:hypothetical protein
VRPSAHSDKATTIHLTRLPITALFM